MPKKQNIDLLIEEGRIDEAVGELNRAIAEHPLDDDLHFRLGKLLWRLGRRGEATSEYLRAIDLNPDSPAAVALESARDVADFFNPDLYNP